MLNKCRSVAEVRRLAKRRLPQPIFDYLDGGAEDEISTRRASEDFDSIMFVPRVLTDVGTIRRGTRLFGREVEAPLLLSPTGLSGLYHPDGECAVAQAAGAAGIAYALSTLGTETIEAVAASTVGPKLLQLYIFKDRGITEALIERARAAGYDGLIVTVDTPVGGNRERDWRNGISVRPRLTSRSIIDFALHPRWSLPALFQPGRFAFGNVPVLPENERGQAPSVGAFVNAQFDRGLTWCDLEWLAQRWSGPLAVKGILDAGDARRAVAAGADTIIVSNHGGRQLDGAVSPISRIAPIADVVAGSATIICDGGIRRGAHIVKALALGADACAIGRPYLFGLAAGGVQGVAHVLSILTEELNRCLALLGVADISRLDRSLLK